MSNADTAPELLPCPFCGGDAGVISHEGRESVQCTNGRCLAFLPGHAQYNDSSKNLSRTGIEWNTRAAPPKLDAPDRPGKWAMQYRQNIGSSGIINFDQKQLDEYNAINAKYKDQWFWYLGPLEETTPESGG